MANQQHGIACVSKAHANALLDVFEYSHHADEWAG
jgi:hypothetical protein